MAEILETPEHKLKENNLKKEQKRFWKQPFFFLQLAFQFAFSAGLILAAIIGLFAFKSSWESILFPDLQKVNSLHHDLTILKAKVEQLSHNVQALSHKDSEFENLKTQISSLQEKVLLLEKEPPKQLIQTVQSTLDQKPAQNFNDYQELWQKLQKQLHEGKICIEELSHLRSKVPTSCEIFAQNLVTFAETSTKSLLLLREELEKIYQAVNSSPSDQTVNLFSSHDSLWHTIGKYLSKWIHIYSSEKRAINSYSLTKFKEGLKFLTQNQLDEAIKSLGNLSSIENMSIWLEEAKRRQKCDQAVNEFDKMLKTTQQIRNKQ